MARQASSKDLSAGSLAGKRAIVIGASMGGLLAARVLADHYEQVTLLERDAFPPAGEQRKGVPQGRHAHAILAQGLQIMEDLFPGLTDHLVGLGADYGDVSENARWYHEGDCHQPAHSGVNAINISRPRLEAEVRARVLSLANVTAVEGCDVLGLLATPDNARVTGVRVIRAGPAAPRRAWQPTWSWTPAGVVRAALPGSKSSAMHGRRTRSSRSASAIPPASTNAGRSTCPASTP